jgi:hypothetical protein
MTKAFGMDLEPKLLPSISSPAVIMNLWEKSHKTPEK